MKTFQHMEVRRLIELTDRFKSVSLGVLGDYFLDKYLDVEPSLAETSIETGKIAHQVVAERHSPGAAGTVVCNLAALGAGTIHAIGYTGDDGASYDLRRGLSELGCLTDDLHLAPSRMTPTYLKPRDQGNPGLAGEHSRYDSKNRVPTPDELQSRILESLDRLLPSLDAVIILDQVEEEECGVVTSRVRTTLAERAAGDRDRVFWGDSRRRIRQFQEVMIKANQFELVGRVDPVPGEAVDVGRIERALRRVRAHTGAPVFVTRGSDGMLVSDPEPTLVPGLQVQGPIDETGAGDSATAGAVLALAAGADLAEAALLGNLVASITIQQLATTGTARPEQLPEQLDLWQRQRKNG